MARATSDNGWLLNPYFSLPWGQKLSPVAFFPHSKANPRDPGAGVSAQSWCHLGSFQMCPWFRT